MPAAAIINSTLAPAVSRLDGLGSSNSTLLPSGQERPVYAALPPFSPQTGTPGPASPGGPTISLLFQRGRIQRSTDQSRDERNN